MKDLFARPSSASNHAILVSVDLGQYAHADSVAELINLAMSAQLQVIHTLQTKRKTADSRFFIGSGKLEELLALCHDAGIVVFNHELSASQQRNLERALNVFVLDRTGLILHIFAKRARSYAGKLQVELAQLEHLSTRLTRGWTHLERQKGGIGLRGGPGETQLELDRRMLRVQVKSLREKINNLQMQRGMQRRVRQRADVFSVALVGYTNAGKSLLFNRLTKASALVADQLFATLDTTTRKMYIADCGEVVLSDTVGFIQSLPHSLVAAFAATLEEAHTADLLLHVLDVSSPTKDVHMLEADKVLHEIGASEIPRIVVYNQIDRLGLTSEVVRNGYGTIRAVYVSAKTGEGLELIRQAILEHRQRHLSERQQ